MPEKKEIWRRIIKRLESKVSRSELEMWFSQTTLKHFDPDLAVIEVPNKFFAGWLRDRYLTDLQESFKQGLNASPTIRFTYAAPSQDEKAQELPHNVAQDLGVHGQLDRMLTFGRFVVGSSNRFAYSSALEIAKRPALHYNPLYIFGEPSVGKTHLLHAIGNHIFNTDPSRKIIYVPAERFISDFSYALRSNKIPGFTEKYEDADVLLVDDIHLLAGKKKLQEELVSLFNRCLESEKQIAVTGIMPPGELQDLHERLKSRLQWGLLSEIQVPDQKTKIEIIQKRADEENLLIPDDVIFFLANTTNDLKTLIRTVIRLVMHASLSQQKVDISAVKSLIKEGPSQRPTVNEIQKSTARYFNISVSDLLSNKKKRKISYPRQMAMFLCRSFTNLSFTEIGEAFGKKDHATVIYAIRRIEKEKDDKKEVLADLANIKNLFT